jgi:peptidoglycan/LPS O-acetylase OafA/YrhL
MLKREVTTSTPLRLPLVDALRAMAATLIAWHHFGLYGLQSTWAAPLPGQWIELLRNYRWAVQVFFVVGGFVTARSMSRRTWNCRQVGRFIVRRYCRLGLPYLAAIALALGACALGRGWVSESVIEPSPTFAQIVAHVVFLQDILGYQALSAGLWFVGIDFQLGLIYVAMLFLRDALARLSGSDEGEPSTVVPILLGWALAAPSLFFFNLHDDLDVWAIYFFGQFFLGVMVYHGLKSSAWMIPLGIYALMLIAALVYDWRWQLATSLLIGLVLFYGGKLGLMERWPTSRVVRYLGRTSYSLFLVHFPVLVVVSTVWARFDWTSPRAAVTAVVVAYIASLMAADVFYRAIDTPAERFSRKFS